MPGLDKLENLAATPIILESHSSLKAPDSSLLDRMAGNSRVPPNPQLFPDERITETRWLPGPCNIVQAVIDSVGSTGEQLRMHALGSIGEQLVAARREQELSIEEIAEQTRIGRGYITALEQNDFTAFPAEFYTVNFLRQYSDALGLASDDLVDALRQQLAAAEDKRKDFAHQAIRLRSQGLLAAAYEKVRRWTREFVANRSKAMVASTLVVGGLAGWWYIGHSQIVAVGAPEDLPGVEAESTPEPDTRVTASGAPEFTPPRSTTPASTGGVPPTEPARSSSSESLSVALRASGIVWVRMVVDGGSPHEAILQVGNQRTLQARERVQITVGNAGAISLVVNGEDQGSLGALGQVRHIQVERDGWKVLPPGSF